MPKTDVYLVRHAHAHWEPNEGRPLSEEGRRGAEALARALAPVPVAAIYCSPARRAIETIQPLARARGLRPQIVPDLRERHLVVAPGGTFERAVETAWKEPSRAAAGGESNQAAAARGMGVLRRILSEHEGQSVVLATHGNLLALILNALDPGHGYETWRSLTFPDVFRLVFRGTALSAVARAWRGPGRGPAELMEGGNGPMDVLHAIGNTSIVPLRRVVPAGCAQVLVKLEWENPTGSVKDRMAQAVISRAEQDGRLRPGGTVVEYTGGSTGTSLALVCAAKGYRIRIVTSDAFSQEKRDHMAALGAELTLVPSEGGLTTRKLILDMIEVARGLSQEPGSYWTDQLNNQDSIAGYYPLGEEIWSQTNGEVDAFVHCAGTAASSRGVATVLKRHQPGVRIVVVEPAESSVLLGGPAGPHKIEGVGIGYTPPLFEPSLVDEVLSVRTDDAKEMARRLAREEALFAGTSSGANVVAAIQVAKRLGPGARVVTLMVDSGLKYLSTDVYRRE